MRRGGARLHAQCARDHPRRRTSQRANASSSTSTAAPALKISSDSSCRWLVVGRRLATVGAVVGPPLASVMGLWACSGSIYAHRNACKRQVPWARCHGPGTALHCCAARRGAALPLLPCPYCPAPPPFPPHLVDCEAGGHQLVLGRRELLNGHVHLAGRHAHQPTTDNQATATCTFITAWPRERQAKRGRAWGVGWVQGRMWRNVMCSLRGTTRAPLCLITPRNVPASAHAHISTHAHAPPALPLSPPPPAPATATLFPSAAPCPPAAFFPLCCPLPPQLALP